MPTRERPAPLVLVATGGADAPFGSYAAVAATGRQLLAAELSRRLGALGAPVVALRPAPPSDEFRWGPWFTAAARAALTATAADRAVDALGYVGAGALALAGDLHAALAALDDCPTDNAAARHLEEAGFTARDLAARPLSRVDVDTPLDLALLRLATRLPRQRHPDATVHRFLEMARLPGGGALEVPHLAEIAEVMRTQRAELVVAGRIPSAVWTQLEHETACRVRAIVEERGMRSARSGTPRSILAALLRRSSAADLVEELAALGDAVILDSRVLMAALAGTADGTAWPPDEERFASDFLDPARVGTPWLRELTEAARASRVPFLLGSHTLVSDGLRLLVEAAWLGR